MSLKPIEALVTYCSPAGATRVAAEAIEKTLRSLSVNVASFSLCSKEGRETALRVFQESRGRFRLLFVGSPVYGFHPLPAVMEFIRRLPSLDGVHTVPFVTWGGVCSGSALFEMGRALEKKGAILSGAMKIVAEHSMSWAFSKPFCGGRPDRKDASRIEEGVKAVHRKVVGNATSSLAPLDISTYTGDTLTTMLEGGFEKSKARLPRIEFDKTLCVECGQCAEVCPVGCITLNPTPAIGEDCIRCYNCAKTCPEGALTADFSKSEEVIRTRIEKLREPQETTVFV